MDKVRVLQIVFLFVQIIAFIPLTAEIFGKMNPDVISVSAAAVGAGLCGNMICAIIRAVRELKRK